MSHHTHVFLSNEETANGAIGATDSMLSTEELAANHLDSVDILGCIDLETGEWLEASGHHYSESDLKTIEQLEEFANSLFSKEQWNYLENELDRHIKNHYYWNAARICEHMDGIKCAVMDGVKWTVKDPFVINDSYLDLPGITDWCGCTCANEVKPKYAVIVDFHS